MTDLERALSELAEHLDTPDSADTADALARRLAALHSGGRHRSRVLLLAAAIAIALATAGVVGVAPARHAVAGWLGIGAVEVRRSERPLPTVSSTSARASSTTTSSTVPTDLADARRAVRFTIATPRGEAEPLRVEVDHRVPGGLVALVYDHFTLVEIATVKTQPPPLTKLVDGGRIEQVRVQGHDGMWIPEPHRIAFVDRNGNYTQDNVRRSGPVLLWESDGVTYRVEGPHTLVQAQEIAASIV